MFLNHYLSMHYPYTCLLFNDDIPFQWNVFYRNHKHLQGAMFIQACSKHTMESILRYKKRRTTDTNANNMEKGIKIGVKLINDVSGLNFDKNSIKILKKYNIPFVLQHSLGNPDVMQKNPKYKNVLLDIYDFFEKKLNNLRQNGIHHNNIILDPGIGFGKNLKHNMTIIKNISIYHSLGLPILLGISRKRFIKDLSGNNDSSLRIGGTISSSIFAMLQGVQMLRVHDVNEVNQAIKVLKALINK